MQPFIFDPSTPHVQSLSQPLRPSQPPTYPTCPCRQTPAHTSLAPTHRPGIRNTGAAPKKSANFLESNVAEVTMSLKSVRRATTLRKMPNNTSAEAEER